MSNINLSTQALHMPDEIALDSISIASETFNWDNFVQPYAESYLGKNLGTLLQTGKHFFDIYPLFAFSSLQSKVRLDKQNAELTDEMHLGLLVEAGYYAYEMLNMESFENRNLSITEQKFFDLLTILYGAIKKQGKLSNENNWQKSFETALKSDNTLLKKMFLIDYSIKILENIDLSGASWSKFHEYQIAGKRIQLDQESFGLYSIKNPLLDEPIHKAKSVYSLGITRVNHSLITSKFEITGSHEITEHQRYIVGTGTDIFKLNGVIKHRKTPDEMRAWHLENQLAKELGIDPSSWFSLEKQRVTSIVNPKSDAGWLGLQGLLESDEYIPMIKASVLSHKLFENEEPFKGRNLDLHVFVENKINREIRGLDTVAGLAYSRSEIDEILNNGLLEPLYRLVHKFGELFQAKGTDSGPDNFAFFKKEGKEVFLPFDRYIKGKTWAFDDSARIACSGPMPINDIKTIQFLYFWHFKKAFKNRKINGRKIKFWHFKDYKIADAAYRTLFGIYRFNEPRVNMQDQRQYMPYHAVVAIDELRELDRKHKFLSQKESIKIDRLYEIASKYDPRERIFCKKTNQHVKVQYDPYRNI